MTRVVVFSNNFMENPISGIFFKIHTCRFNNYHLLQIIIPNRTKERKHNGNLTNKSFRSFCFKFCIWNEVVRRQFENLLKWLQSNLFYSIERKKTSKWPKIHERSYITLLAPKKSCFEAILWIHYVNRRWKNII